MGQIHQARTEADKPTSRTDIHLLVSEGFGPRRCMNQLLLERSEGNLGPNAFARLESSRLLSSFGAAPLFRFDGGEGGTSIVGGGGEGSSVGKKADIWAHQAGVNALALERFDGRM